MHYSLDNLRHSLRHFFIGKAASAIIALLLMVLLARWLPKEDYAVYVSLQALLVIVSYVTSFGINQSLLRYIPELRVAGNNLPLYRMVVRSLLARFIAIGLGFFVIWTLLPWLGRWFNLSRWQDWVSVYLLVGWLRLFGQFLGRIMETLLWQKQSQYSQAAGSFIRLVAIALAATYATVDIPTLFVIELASEGLIVMFLAAGYVRQWRADSNRNEGDPDWWHTHRVRSRRYALWSYLSTLTSVLANSAPYRLVAAKMLLPEGVALYGFASGVSDMLNRYTPTRLMQSTIRSVLVARFAETSNRDDLIAKLSLNFRANALMLSIFAALTLSSAHPVLDWLTHGKYANADMLLASLIGILLLDVMRAQLEMFAEVTEQNQWVFAGGFMLLLGLVSTIPLSSLFGTWGLLIGNAIGEILAILLMSIGLKVRVVMSLVSVRMLIFLLLLCILEYVVLLLSSTIHGGVIFSTSVTIIACVALLWFVAPFSKEEMHKLSMLLRGGQT